MLVGPSGKQAEPSVRWAAYRLQSETVKIHMCVVALTTGIAACSIKLMDDLSAVRHECDTEQILVAAVHEQRVFGGVCTT